MRIFNLMPVLTLTAVLALGRQTVAAQSATSSALVRTNAVVRSQASQSGERIGLLRAGEEVVVLQEVPGWKRVQMCIRDRCRNIAAHIVLSLVAYTTQWNQRVRRADFRLRESGNEMYRERTWVTSSYTCLLYTSRCV